MGTEQAERAEARRRAAVFVDGILLRQGIAHGHDDAALDLALAGERVDGLADVVRGYHFADEAGLLVEDADLRGVAVGDVGDRVRHIRTERVGLREVFAVEFFPDEVAERLSGQRLVELQAGAAAGLAGHKRLAGAGRVAGVRGNPGVGTLIDDVVAGEVRV